MTIRKAGMDDIPLLLRLRMDYLKEDKGDMAPEVEAEILRRLKPYFERHLPDGSFICMIAEDAGEVMAAACLVISEMPPNPSFMNGITGTLVNVLTYPGYRRQGIATKVLEKLLREAKRLQVSSVSLSATADGKPLYGKLGFQVSHYTSMSIHLGD